MLVAPFLLAPEHDINATPPSLPGDQRPVTCQRAKPAQSI
jgi:hypothetical protein